MSCKHVSHKKSFKHLHVVPCSGCRAPCNSLQLVKDTNIQTLHESIQVLIHLPKVSATISIRHMVLNTGQLQVARSQTNALTAWVEKIIIIKDSNINWKHTWFVYEKAPYGPPWDLTHQPQEHPQWKGTWLRLASSHPCNISSTQTHIGPRNHSKLRSRPLLHLNFNHK